MAAPHRGNTIVTLVCLGTLAVTEYGTITYAVLPLPSTRTDWLIATLFIAPFLATVTLWLVALTLRVGADTLAGLRTMCRWMTGARR